MALGMQRFGPGHIVLEGDQTSPPQKWGTPPPPQFSAHVYCVPSGQTAGWIKMALGMEVGLGPGHIVLQLPFPKKGAQPPNYRSMSIAAKRLDASVWYGGRPQPR